MTGFKDERDVIVTMPFVTHGHATQGESKKDGPGEYGYSLYPARAQLARLAYQHDHAGEPGCPFRLFEFGTLLAYALAAVSHAFDKAQNKPEVTIGFCDDESTEPGSNAKALENLASVGFPDPFLCMERHEAPAFGTASMVMVDGSHDFENTMLDVGMAMLMQPCIVTLDDVIPSHQDVIDALKLCAPLFPSAFRVPTVNGLGVLSSIPGLRAKMNKAGWVTQDVDGDWGA